MMTSLLAFLNLYDVTIYLTKVGNILPTVSATEWKKIDFDFKDENITNRFCR